MPPCSRDSIPACVVCDQPTMEAGADDSPWSKDWTGDGWVCSLECEMRDKLASADPDADAQMIVQAAAQLADVGELVTLRFVRDGCEPVEGVVKIEDAREVVIEDDNGDERVILLGMIGRVEVVEDA